MKDDITIFLLIGLIVNVVIIFLFYSVLSSIEKNQKRTTYLLKLLYEKDGTKLTNEQLTMLNRL